MKRTVVGEGLDQVRRRPSGVVTGVSAAGAFSRLARDEIMLAKASPIFAAASGESSWMSQMRWWS